MKDSDLIGGRLKPVWSHHPRPKTGLAEIKAARYYCRARSVSCREEYRVLPMTLLSMRSLRAVRVLVSLMLATACAPTGDSRGTATPAARAAATGRKAVLSAAEQERAAAQSAREAVADSAKRATARATATRALAKVQLRRDEFSGSVSVEPRGTSRYWNTSSGLRPSFFVGTNGDVRGPMLTTTYMGESWVFFDRVTVLADGTTVTLSVAEDAVKGRQTNVNGDGTLSEAASFPATAETPAGRVIQSMITAVGPVKVRLAGDDNQTTRTLRAGEIEGARAVMAALAALEALAMSDRTELLAKRLPRGS